MLGRRVALDENRAVLVDPLRWLPSPSAPDPRVRGQGLQNVCPTRDESAGERGPAWSVSLKGQPLCLAIELISNVEHIKKLERKEEIINSNLKKEKLVLWL